MRFRTGTTDDVATLWALGAGGGGCARVACARPAAAIIRPK